MTDEDWYALIIGPERQDRYLRIFEAFDARGRVTPHWHWPAFFITTFWLVYRKMWVAALLWPLLFGGLTIMLAYGNKEFIGSPAWVALLLAYYVLPALFADALYYLVCRRRIRKAQERTVKWRGQVELVKRKSGTSPIAVSIVFFVTMVLPLLIP